MIHMYTGYSNIEYKRARGVKSRETKQKTEINLAICRVIL